MQPAAFLLHVFLLASSVSDGDPSRSPWPGNIWVQPELRESVTRIWDASPTFRAQCLKIGARKHYQVQVLLEPALSSARRCRAQCVIQRFTTGLVIARVTVPSRRDLDELIPHEFEHISEYIDGLNVRNDAKVGARGAFDAGEGRVETNRAIQAGKQARSEMQIVHVMSRR